MPMEIYLGCVWKSLFTVYLSLSSHISTCDKNYKYLKKLIKIVYIPYKLLLAYFNKLLLAYFNKLNEETYKKKTQNSLWGRLKLIILMTKM